MYLFYSDILPEKGPTGTYTYNVTGLRPFSTYQLRVRAENEIGTSEPSKPTDQFTTESIKPDLYPQQVGGGGGKSVICVQQVWVCI